jgi:hypothetical protein
MALLYCKEWQYLLFHKVQNVDKRKLYEEDVNILNVPLERCSMGLNPGTKDAWSC